MMRLRNLDRRLYEVTLTDRNKQPVRFSVDTKKVDVSRKLIIFSHQTYSPLFNTFVGHFIESSAITSMVEFYKHHHTNFMTWLISYSPLSASTFPDLVRHVLDVEWMRKQGTANEAKNPMIHEDKIIRKNNKYNLNRNFVQTQWAMRALICLIYRHIVSHHYIMTLFGTTKWALIRRILDRAV